MKIASITGANSVELTDVPPPRAKGKNVVVKILVAPLCTEYKTWERGDSPKMLGHEAAGVVFETDSESSLHEGDRVIVMPQTPCGECRLCRTGDYIHCQNVIDMEHETGYTHGFGTLAQFMLKQERQLIPIPKDLSLDHASMACCGLGPSFNAMKMMNVSAADSVLIVGLGPVGLGGVINGVHRGAKIIGVDGSEYRRDLARKLGATQALSTGSGTLDAIQEMTDGRGVDKAMDCTAVPSAQRFMIDAVRRRGQAAFVGWGGEIQLDVQTDMIQKGLTLHGIWHWNIEDTDDMLNLIRARRNLIDHVITHILPLTGIQKAFELQSRAQCGKIILHPWEDAVE